MLRVGIFTMICFCHVSGTLTAPKPNIIMIVADDLGWDDVSFHGSSHIPTPNIDALANGGVILNSHYVSPICTPTRASLMTGKHPINLGLQHGTIFGTQPFGLPLKERTTPQYLKSLGYKAHGVGKWHLGFFEKEYTPTFRGFDSFYGFWTGKTDYWDHWSYEDYWGLDLRDGMKPVTNETGHYNTELFTEVAEKIISTHNKSTPLFLYIAHQAVHTANLQSPLQAPQRLLDKFSHFISKERQTYAAMVASLDESVGNITKALKRSGLFNDSVIVFITDNGGPPRGFDWSESCNYPFKGGKDTLWEGGVRGVAFVHSNLISKKRRVSYELIDVTDWLPTFYHLAGGDVAQIQDKIDGMNVWDTIAHEMTSPRTEVLHNVDPIRQFAAIRVNQFKLIVNQDAVYNTTWHPRYSTRAELNEPLTLPGAVIDCGLTDGLKKVHCDTNAFPCLFDISQDPCEYRNIAQTNLPTVQLLLQRISKLKKKSIPVWYPERDPLADPAQHGNVWSPWKVPETNTTLSPGDEESAPFADKPEDTKTNGHVISSSNADCCSKYYNFSGGLEFRHNNTKTFNDEQQESLFSSKTGTNLTGDNKEPESTRKNCCLFTSGDVKEWQVKNCCLSNRPSLADFVAIQSRMEVEVFDLLHEILDLPEVSMTDAVAKSKKNPTGKLWID